MGLFSPNAQLEKKVKDLELTKRLDKGKHEKELSEQKRQNDRLTSRITDLESKLEDVNETLGYYKGLENDRLKIESDKKAVKLDRQDIEDLKTEVERKEARLTKKAERLEQEENDEYKKGYSDGLADGLRKAHDITREDRKYMTMIAMSTNQSKAIETSVKALEGGFKNDSDGESK